MIKGFLTSVFIGVCSLTAFTAFAEPGIITPTGATSTTTIGSPRIILATLDGSLLSSSGASGDILSETVTYAGNNGHWLSGSTSVDDDANFKSTTEELIFTLGGSFDVNAMHLWPYVRPENYRGLKTCDISFSFDGGTTYPTTISAATLGDFTIGTTSSSPVTEPVSTKTFTAQSGVTHIKLTNLTTFGSTSYIAIAELRFGAPPPPAATVFYIK